MYAGLATSLQNFKYSFNNKYLFDLHVSISYFEGIVELLVANYLFNDTHTSVFIRIIEISYTITMRLFPHLPIQNIAPWMRARWWHFAFAHC